LSMPGGKKKNQAWRASTEEPKKKVGKVKRRYEEGSHQIGKKGRASPGRRRSPQKGDYTRKVRYDNSEHRLEEICDAERTVR